MGAPNSNPILFGNTMAAETRCPLMLVSSNQAKCSVLKDKQEYSVIVLLTELQPNNLNASEVIKSLAESPSLEIEQHMDSMHFEIMPGKTESLINHH